MGAAYLLYMAYGALKEKPARIEHSGNDTVEQFSKLFTKGFIMNVLNPKVTLFFILLLPQFVSSDGWSPMLQMMILGLIFMVVSFPVFATAAVLAGSAASLVQKPWFWSLSKALKVIVLMCLAILLALSQQ